MKYLSRLLFIMLLPVSCLAQFKVTGRVLNMADTKPVANASVFLSNTTIGTTTAKDGAFTLSNIKTGKYNLVISVVGFETYSQPIIISDHDIALPAISIPAKTIGLKEVKIKAGPNKKNYYNWFYELFKNEFLGPSDLAAECTILNPEVLDFSYDGPANTVTVVSAGFLEIENAALGYKVKYLLSNLTLVDPKKADESVHYEGAVLFNEMKGTPAQERRWQQRRLDTYLGSELHFFRSAMSDRLEESGFEALQLATYANPKRPSDSLIKAKISQFDHPPPGDKAIKTPDSLLFWIAQSKRPKKLQTLFPFPLYKSDLVTNTDEPGIFALGCDTAKLLVDYNKKRDFPEVKQLANIDNLNYILNKADNKELTLLHFTVPFAFFDNNGWVHNPNSLEFNGAWSRNRIADLLPVNYEPPRQENEQIDTLLKSDSLLNKVSNKLEAFSTAHPAEKVYLHLDKPNYNFGDTIWYKAYTVIGQHHQLSGLSGVLYVELISPKDSLVTRQILPLVSGVGWSDIPLAHGLKQGLYLVRAYTNYMRNDVPDCFFNQRIRVGGIAPPGPVQQTAVQNPDVQFFPEGGQLVNGVRSRVAIKAVGVNGLGADIKGTIEDNAGNVVTEFATQHLGMGVFALIPESGKTYKAKISGPGEISFTVDLPGAQEEGFVLSLNNSQPDSIFIKVAVNEKVLNEQKNSAFYIIAQSNGKIYYTSTGKLNGLVYVAKTDKARFPSGIAQFTLFNKNGEPLAERIAFIQNKDTLNLKIDSATQNYTTRQHVKLALSAKDNNNNAVTGSFSVAVINESRVGINAPGESTIINNLLLTTDLKGYIEQPNYYFTNTNDETRANLDLLMLTQGYRRFEWKNILNHPDQMVNYQPERSLQLSGAVKTPGGAAVPNGKVTFIATKQNLLMDTVTDVTGNFKFPGLFLPDSSKVIIRARKEKNGSNVAIYLKQPDYPPVIKQSQTNLTADLSPELAAIFQKNNMEYQRKLKEDSLKNGIGLKEVKIVGRKISKPDVYNNYGTSLEYDVDMGRFRKESTNIEDALPSMVPGLTALGRVFVYEQQRVQVIIDGLPRDEDACGYFSPAEIEDIRMVSASSRSSPTLVITTKSYAGTDTTSTLALKQVTIQAKKINKGPDLSNSSNLNGPGNADQIIMGDKIEGCITLSDCLNGSIMGVSFDQNGVPHSTRSRTASAMAVIVDGIVMGGDHLNDVNAADIASIEVLRSGAYLAVYGSSAEGGALVITTKRQTGNYLTSETPAGLITYLFNGFYKTRAFYTPKYTGPLTAVQTPDLRNAIYWNPNIITDKEGKAIFEYFNNDTKGIYRVVVEGIDDNGNLGRMVYRYKVE